MWWCFAVAGVTLQIARLQTWPPTPESTEPRASFRFRTVGGTECEIAGLAASTMEFRELALQLSGKLRVRPENMRLLVGSCPVGNAGWILPPQWGHYLLPLARERRRDLPDITVVRSR